MARLANERRFRASVARLSSVNLTRCAEEVFETDVSIRRLLWRTERRKCWWRPSLGNRIAARDGVSYGRRSVVGTPPSCARAGSVHPPQIEAKSNESGVVNAFVNAFVNGASASSPV